MTNVDDSKILFVHNKSGIYTGAKIKGCSSSSMYNVLASAGASVIPCITNKPEIIVCSPYSGYLTISFLTPIKLPSFCIFTKYIPGSKRSLLMTTD